MEKKKIFTIISIVAVIVLVIIIGVIISIQLKWKDFETCKTDKFTIKYNKNWKITDDLSDFYGKNFEYGNNKIEFYLMKKAELPSTRNTATKLKDETLKQLSSSNMDKLSENSLFDYKVSKLNTDDIKVRRWIESGEVKAGDLVVVEYEGEISGNYEVKGAYSIFTGTLEENGILNQE